MVISGVTVVDGAETAVSFSYFCNIVFKIVTHWTNPIWDRNKNDLWVCSGN